MSDKCETCGKKIECGPSLMAFDKAFHPECFLCGHCKKRIVNPDFHQKDNKPFCDNCWVTLYQRKCQECRLVLKDNEDYMVHDGRSYHKKCFTCSTCHCPLANKKFGTKDKKIVCENHVK